MPSWIEYEEFYGGGTDRRETSSHSRRREDCEKASLKVMLVVHTGRVRCAPASEAWTRANRESHADGHSTRMAMRLKRRKSAMNDPCGLSFRPWLPPFRSGSRNRQRGLVSASQSTVQKRPHGRSTTYSLMEQYCARKVISIKRLLFKPISGLHEASTRGIHTLTRKTSIWHFERLVEYPSFASRLFVIFIICRS